MTKLSIVSTLYRSEPHVEEFLLRISDAAKKQTDDYEIILVNDGSPDKALERASEMQEKLPLKLIDLSRNFGHHVALMEGVRQSVGDLVFLIDSDLEEDPADLASFYCMLNQSDCDVVYGVQNTRKGGFFEKWSGRIFYWVIDRISVTAAQTNSVTARLMTRRYVDALTSYNETVYAIGDLWISAGFEQKPLKINKHSKGETSYSTSKRIGNAFRYITASSTAPLQWFFWFGGVIFLGSLLSILVLIGLQLFGVVTVKGWVSILITILFFGGINIMGVGLVGIYVAHVFKEAKNRPTPIVRNIISKNNEY